MMMNGGMGDGAMMGDGMMGDGFMGWGGMIFGPLMMIAFVALIIFGVVAIVKSVSEPKS